MKIPCLGEALPRRNGDFTELSAAQLAGNAISNIRDALNRGPFQNRKTKRKEQAVEEKEKKKTTQVLE